MTTRRFPFKQPDGTIAVFIPEPKSRRLGETEEVWIKRVVGKNYRGEPLPECGATDLPDREFRNAWKANPDGTIRVDAQLKQQIIEERAKLSIEDRLAKLEELNEAQIR